MNGKAFLAAFVAAARYTPGGCQLLKKWLSGREQDLLGRPSALDRVRVFNANAHCIAAQLALHDPIGAICETVSAKTMAFERRP